MVDPTKESEPETGSPKPSNSSKGTSPGITASLEAKYEGIIEFGKRKLHYYDPNVTENDRFLMSFLIYFMFLLMVVFIADYLAQMTYEDSDSLGPLQHLEVEIVYQVQKDYFDMPVYVNRTSKTIWYDTTKEWNGQNFTTDERIGGFGLQIDSVCTGFHEMVFLGVLVMGFRGVSVKLRAKWTVILLGIVFVENLFRIFALYPLALYQGREFEEWFHHYWWHYGQYAFIMLLFGLWFFFVARKQIGPDKDKEESGEKGESKTGEKPPAKPMIGSEKRTKENREAAYDRFRKKRESYQLAHSDDSKDNEVETDGEKPRDEKDRTQGKEGAEENLTEGNEGIGEDRTERNEGVGDNRTEEDDGDAVKPVFLPDDPERDENQPEFLPDDPEKKEDGSESDPDKVDPEDTFWLDWKQELDDI